MKIGLLIDSLDSGGAERQLVELALGMNRRGYEIQLLYYSDRDFFKSRLQSNGIDVIHCQESNSLDKIRFVRSWLKRFRPDIAQAFLRGPSINLILAGMLGRTWKTVVSERTLATFGDWQRRVARSRHLFRFADWVISNSESNLADIVTNSSFLTKKASAIVNGIDTEVFIPKTKMDDKPFTLVAVSSIIPLKNIKGIIKAITLLKNRDKLTVNLIYVGGSKGLEGKLYLEELGKEISQNNIQDQIEFVGEQEAVVPFYQQADAFILASFVEGFPNALVEAMSCGLPVIGSTVSDIPLIIQENINGFCFDPHDPESIAKSIKRLVDLAVEGRATFGIASRQCAVQKYSLNRMLDNYEALYRDLTNNRIPMVSNEVRQFSSADSK